MYSGQSFEPSLKDQSHDTAGCWFKTLRGRPDCWSRCHAGSRMHFFISRYVKLLLTSRFVLAMPRIVCLLVLLVSPEVLPADVIIRSMPCFSVQNCKSLVPLARKTPFRSSISRTGIAACEQLRFQIAFGYPSDDVIVGKLS